MIFRKRFCDKCSFWSQEHDLCFHPETWTQGALFKVPGDPKVLNRDNKCRLYDSRPAKRGKWRIRITK